MVWLVLISVVLIAGGWLIGRLSAFALAARAFALVAIVPVLSVIDRVWYAHRYGQPPETWLANTVLFTAFAVVLVAVGAFGRWCFSQRSN